MATEGSLPTLSKDSQPNRTDTEILGDLERLCEEPGFIYSLCLMVESSLWIHSDELADIDWNIRPNQGELSLLLGLLAKHPIKLNVALSEDGVLEQVGRATELLN